MISIKFSTNKNGQKVAYEWHNAAMRWVRMNLAKAELLVATGENVEVC
jgi:hypothetical protein